MGIYISPPSTLPLLSLPYPTTPNRYLPKTTHAAKPNTPADNNPPPSFPAPELTAVGCPVTALAAPVPVGPGTPLVVVFSVIAANS